MKKVIPVIGIALCTVFGLQGCSSENNVERVNPKSIKQASKQEEKIEQGEVGKLQHIDSLDITLKEVIFTSDRNHIDEKQSSKIVRIQIQVKNVGTEDIGIGSGDFKVHDEDGKAYEPYGHDQNFGDVLAPGKELTGYAYFTVSEGKPTTIIYQSSKGESIEWKIGKKS
ncbi:DUF4352 domain-containing protein [Bacillus cereus]|uniref:DUF4352 domain-containing protein n=1 Tax=Bacillus cereus TaxID=1396 RepID=A0A2B9ECJ8_BACCE|nr:DUF4352 domain-containing protein [Bacillus cereus]PGM97603.1 hypothetical protein CN958_02210 [Bacillus cereus]